MAGASPTMTTPFTEPRQANKKEQPDSQPSSQLPSVVSWSDPYSSQLVGYGQLPGFTQTHPTARTDIHNSSSFNFTGPLEGVFPQGSFATLSHSSTSPTHFGGLRDGMAGEWSIQHPQQPSETHSQAFDARIQHQGQIQPTSDFQPRANLGQPGGPFIHLSGIPTHSTAYSPSHHHPLTPMPPVSTLSPSGPARVESNDILHENIDSVTTPFQVQQYGPAYLHDAQPTQRFFGFSTQSPRSSISQEDAYSMTLAMNQAPITEGQPAPETSNILSRGPNERQVGTLTVATSNLALSTPCTSPSVSISPYSASQLQPDTPAGTAGITGPARTTEGTMDSLGKSSGSQYIPAKGKRRTRGNKGNPSGPATGDPFPPEAAGAASHKKIANKRSRDRLNQTYSTSPLPLLQHSSTTLVPYTFSPASSDSLPHTPSSSSPHSVASSSSISMGLPPQPPGPPHNNPYAVHTSSINLSTGQVSGTAPGGPKYAHSHPSQSQQFRSANLQYHTQQVQQAQHPSYNYNTTASPPPPPPNAFADTYRDVRTVAGMNTFKNHAAGLIHTLDSPQDLPRQILNRRRSSQGYSSDTVSTPGEGYPTRSDYFGYSSLPYQTPQPPQPSALYHQYQQDHSSYLHSGHLTQLPSQPLNLQQPQQRQQYHPQEPFQDQLYHQHQQRRQKQYQLMHQQNQQHHQLLQQQYQLHLKHQQQLQLQHQQQQQHMQQAQRSQFGSIFAQVDPQELGTQSDDEYSSHTTTSIDALVNSGQVKVPRTRARSRTLPTLEDLEDIVLEPLAAETQALVPVSSQRTGGWSVSAQPAQIGSSIAIAFHLRTTVDVTCLQDEHRSAIETVPSARIVELGSRSPSLSPEKESEPAIVCGAAPDLEDEVKETAVSSIHIESSSSSSTVVSSRPARHPCPRCSKRFTRPFNLRSHMLAHDNERPYACDGKMTTGAKCKSRFSRRADLVRHIKAKHPNYTKDKNQPQESTSNNNSDEMD